MTLFQVEPLERRTLLAVNPAGFVQTTFATNIASPTAMEFAPDGRLFVAQQGGALRVIKDGQLLPEPFVDLPVNSSGERGLLGIAFDPDFDTNRYVYLYWTANSPTLHNRVSRFTADGDVAAAGSQVDILDLPTLSATNHNGGAIHFGGDGKLYVAVGDNAVPSNSQSMDTTLGKVLRINTDGGIPTDNPFYGTAAGQNRAVWTNGLRNPYTFAVQPGTGRIFINDVGQNTFEEINEGRAGANYGWPTTEGGTDDPRFDAPVHFYGHGDGVSCSIAGGAFYNPPGAQFPASYTGDYFFADYCGGYVKVLDIGSGDVSTFATGLGGAVDLKVGPDGSLYSLSRDAGGRVHKFTYAPSGGPAITTQPASVTVAAGQPATFTVTASGTAPLAYQWQRNGTNIPGATSASYTLPAAAASDDGAQFQVIVTNSGGSVTSNPATLTVAASSGAPAAGITGPAFGARYRAGDTITFAGSAADAAGADLPAGAYTWEVVFHHADHTHPFVAPFSGQTGGSFLVPTTGETAADVFYRIRLTVTDSGGLTREATRDVLPRTARMSLSANVPGVQLLLDGQPSAAPVTFAGVAGMTRSVEAPASQTINGVTYDFVSWSDGGAAAHDVTVPDADTTYTALYRATSPVAGDGADLTAEVITPLPDLSIGGGRGRAVVRVSNPGTAAVAGRTGLALFLSSDAMLDASDAAVGSATKRLRLRPGAARSVRMRYVVPPVVDGPYYLLAQVDPANALTEADESNNVGASAAAKVEPPAVNLSGELAAPIPTTVAGGRRSSVVLNLTNAGNVRVRGPLAVTLHAAAGSADGPLVPLRTLSVRSGLAPGVTRSRRLRFVTPRDLPAGSYFFSAVIDSANKFGETDEADNALAGGVFQVT